jgi:Na+-transporting NADH:ubiquinone oxidoreductase subunit D
MGFEVLGHKAKTLAESTGVYSFGYENNGFMLLSPMALITVGIIIWIQRARNRKLIEN